MTKIIVALKNRLFKQSLENYLVKEGLADVLSDALGFDRAILEKHNPDIVLAELPVDLDSFKSLSKQFSDVKFLVIGNNLSTDQYHLLISSGVKGCLTYSSELQELKTAIDDIASGKIYFPHEVLQNLMLHPHVVVDKHTNILTEREIEILQLLCEGMSNEQISDRIHLSYDTVKWHRSNILIKCGCNNILSLYKYAVSNKLVQASAIQ